MYQVAVGTMAFCFLTTTLSAQTLTPSIDEGARGALSVEVKPRKWLPDAAYGWMGKLPDTLSIADVSIPGTYDSGAWQGGVGCRTQSWPISKQLEGVFVIWIFASGASTKAVHPPWFPRRMRFAQCGVRQDSRGYPRVPAGHPDRGFAYASQGRGRAKRR